jgi:CHAT domain-containing protein
MQIAQKTLAGPGEEGAQTHRQLLVDLNVQKERLEAELARKIPEINLERKLRAVDRSVIAQALPGQSVLVEFVRFKVFNFKAVPARGETQWKPARYVAFIIPAAQPDDVQMIDLGEAKPIDRMIAALRSLITHESENGGSRGLGALPVEEVQTESQLKGIELRKTIFDPLITALRGRKRLMLAPDGDLTRLPFEILPTDEGHCLIDDYRISYLSTGRDLLRFATESTIQPEEPLLIADPDFDLGDTLSTTPVETTHPSGRQSRDLKRADLHFGQLPATRLEGERIGKMLEVQPWLEGAALEAHLKACRSPRILHMATHGFFLEDREQESNQEFPGLGAVGWQEEGDVGRLSGAGLENPLLRSGLALAGANTWLMRGNPPVEAEDGILTAEDVSGLDLLATEMVVLSACETGLGEIRTGEGVFGLRRAFVLAGARTLVMSLWKVPDQETQELMEDFYRRVLDGQSRAGALREAQLAIRAKHPDPLYWGAFICQGDPSPLSGTN